MCIAQALGRAAKECKATIVSTGNSILGGSTALSTVSSGLSLFRQDKVLTLNQRAAKEEESTAFKILQTITMLVDSRSVELSKEVLSQCLMVCCTLAEQNIKRASVATMNQVLSILFERGKDVMLGSGCGGGDTDAANDEMIEHDETLILNVALETLTDLCRLVHNSQDAEKRDVMGPFALAVREGMAPSPTTCLSLLDMIFKQRGDDLFRVCQQHFDTRSSDAQTNDTHLQFATLSIHQTCQLVLSMLQTPRSKYNTPLSDSMAFCFFYYATSLGSTILSNYLTSSSLDFYKKFDSIQLSNVNAQAMSQSALKMIQLLVGHVSAATLEYHKSEFEDGYVFNQTERESLNIGKEEDVASTAEDAVKNRNTAQNDTMQPTPDTLVSNDQLWRAFLSLEVIYSLMCSHLKQIVLLDTCQSSSLDEPRLEANGNESSNIETVSVITKATSDLATISGSNRERILHVVLIAHDDTSAVGEPSKAAASLAEKFSDSQSDRSTEMPVCDTGLATWLSFKCVLALVKSLKEIVVSSNESDNAELQQIHTKHILNEAFAPSVSVLQHYIKRMSGSHIVVSQTLSAYENLAYVSMALDEIEENLRRHAILTSLCKLCLPSWGKSREHT